MGFDEIVTLIFGAEGGFDDSPADRGNWTSGKIGEGTLAGTKFGISAAAYPSLDIRNLTIEAATAIYRVNYWNKISGDLLPWQIGLLAFDAAVNQGPGEAAKLLQQAADVDTDGVVGPVTISAISRKAAGGLPALICEMSARRAVRYAMTGESDISTFGLGWMRRLEDMTRIALGA
jgi:lysozyme family protein